MKLKKFDSITHFEFEYFIYFHDSYDYFKFRSGISFVSIFITSHKCISSSGDVFYR